MQSSTDGMVIEKDDKGNSNTHHHLNTHDDAKLSSSDNEQEIVTLKELLKSGPKFDEEDAKLPSSDSDEEIVTLEELLKNSKNAIQFEDNYQSTVWQQGEAHQHESQEESDYSPYWREVRAKPHNVRFREYLRTHGDEYPSVYDEQGPPSPDRPISSLLMDLQAEASHGSEVSFPTDSFLTPATTTKVKQDNSFNFANI